MKRLFAVLILLMAQTALCEPYNATTEPSLSDIDRDSLLKINKILYDAKNPGTPLAVTVAGGGSSAPTYSQVATSGTTVTTTLTTIRAADSSAVKTTVVNTGAGRVVLFEGGGAVAVLNADQTWDSPLSGKLALTGSCVSGSSSVIVSTYK